MKWELWTELRITLGVVIRFRRHFFRVEYYLAGVPGLFSRMAVFGWGSSGGSAGPVAVSLCHALFMIVRGTIT